LRFLRLSSPLNLSEPELKKEGIKTAIHWQAVSALPSTFNLCKAALKMEWMKISPNDPSIPRL
jgi:hypothetical protein